MISSRHIPRRTRHIASILLALLVAVACCVAAPSQVESAFAAARHSDIVGGATAAERGLNMTNAPSIEADYAYVIDENGKVYFERYPDERTNIASITKIMTAIIALENASLDDTVTVSVSAASVGESSAGLLPGDTLNLEDALMGLMVPSGNDAAIAIAESLGNSILDASIQNGSPLADSSGEAIEPNSSNSAIRAFVAKMNEKAKELGCENTLYANPHGLDIGQFETDMYSSARDVATISAYAMQNDFFRSIVDLPLATLSVSRNGVPVDVTVTTTDELLGSYPGACGIKTGFTDAAGACFAGACNRDDLMLYAIVLGSPTESQRFMDARALFDWVYGSEVSYKLANSDEQATMDVEGFPSQVPVVANVALADWNYRTVPVTLANPEETIDVSSIFGNVSQEIAVEPISGSVEAGSVVGKANFYQHNNLIASVDVVACQDISPPDAFAAMGIAWERLTGFFNGSDPVARTIICNETPLILQKN